MQRIERKSGPSNEEMQKIEQELIAGGFIKVDQQAKLVENQYQISSHTGDENSFGSEKKI